MGYGLVPFRVDFTKLAAEATTRERLDAATLMALCERLGESLPNDHWYPVRVDYFAEVDRALARAGSAAKLQPVVFAGPPIRLAVLPDDFPVLGSIASAHAAVLRDAIGNLPVATVDDGPIPDDFPEGSYTFRRAFDERWTLTWRGLEVSERGYRKRSAKKFASPEAAQAEARVRFEHRLELGFEPTPGAVADLRGERPVSLADGFYQLTKGKVSCVIELADCVVMIDLDRGHGTPESTERKLATSALARSFAEETIAMKLADGFEPDDDTDARLPRPATAPTAEKLARSPLPPSIAKSVEQFRSWLDTAARTNTGLVFFYS